MATVIVGDLWRLSFLAVDLDCCFEQWARERSPKVCRTEHFYKAFYCNIPRMKTGDLTKKQLSSVPCPMCGVPAGHRCLLQAGGLRNEPHTGRKLIATEMVERKRTRLKRDSSRASASI